MSDDTLLDGNENLCLYFDDDGEDLKPGDRVLVNDETEARICEIDGERFLTGFPKNEIVEHIELMKPDNDDWPDSVD